MDYYAIARIAGWNGVLKVEIASRDCTPDFSVVFIISATVKVPVGRCMVTFITLMEIFTNCYLYGDTVSFLTSMKTL